MITTIKLATTSNPSHSYHFFFVMRTLKIFSLSNFILLPFVFSKFPSVYIFTLKRTLKFICK